MGTISRIRRRASSSTMPSAHCEDTNMAALVADLSRTALRIDEACGGPTLDKSCLQEFQRGTSGPKKRATGDRSREKSPVVAGSSVTYFFEIEPLVMRVYPKVVLDAASLNATFLKKSAAPGARTKCAALAMTPSTAIDRGRCRKRHR